MSALQESLYTPRGGSSLVRLCTLPLHTTHAPSAHPWARLAVYLMIVLFLLFILFLPCGSSSSTGAGDSRVALLRRVTLDDRPAAPETHLCLG